jgi:penicillin amidase
VSTVDVARVQGLTEDVVVHRDEWGIPHVRAATALDAFFGQGFVQAADRLGQLEYDRRRGTGRWAEVAGATAVAFDVFVRRCGLRAAAEAEYAALDDDARAVLDAFCLGINAFLALDRPLPTDLALAGVTPEPWQPWECCAVFLVRHVVFASWQTKLWRGRLAVALGVEAVARIEGADPREVPLIVPPGALFEPRVADPAPIDAVLAATAPLVEASAGSNSWALAGEHTASGLPLVAGDPHRLVEVPGVYAQAHLACSEFDAVGLSFVGVPGLPHFGRTDDLAWCVTNANGDYQDLYVERFDDVPAPTRTETIVVRGADTVTIECFATHRGPVVFGDVASGYAISLRSTALVEPSSGLGVLAPMLCARSVDELDDVMRDWVDPVNNLVSADASGAIAYRTVGRIPIRHAANAWGPVPAWTGDHDWTGVVPYDELPHARDPEVGRLVTANQRIVDDSYPYVLGLDYSRPDRATRVHARLEDLAAATVGDMAAIHADRRSLAADVWVDRLLAVDASDDWERAALDELRRWDRIVDAGSVAASIYVVVRDAVGKRVAHHPELAALRTPFADEPASTFQPVELRLWVRLTGLLLRDDTMLLGPGETWASVLAAGLADGVAVLRSAFGDDLASWEWGGLHESAPRHPLSPTHPEWAERLDPAPVPMGGEWDTVFSAAHPAGFGFGVTSASVARYAFDLADRRNDAWVVPLGSSGDAASPHFADQRGAWAAARLLPIVTTWADLGEPWCRLTTSGV